jgi:hypothetical protein
MHIYDVAIILYKISGALMKSLKASVFFEKRSDPCAHDRHLAQFKKQRVALSRCGGVVLFERVVRSAKRSELGYRVSGS